MSADDLPGQTGISSTGSVYPLPKLPAAQRTADVSVILATKNRAAILAETLAAMARQELGGLNVEYLVVDNGSRDATPEVLQAWGARLPLLHWSEPRPGKNICLNQAVSRARSELLVFTDDDVRPDPEWLQMLIQAASRWPHHAMFGGAIDPVFPRELSPEVRALQDYFGVLYSRYRPADTEGVVANPPFGPNLLIRRIVFEHGMYNESIGPAGAAYAMGSETEFLVRMKARLGLDFVYVPSARVLHVIQPEQLEPDWIWGRAHRAGRGMARLMRSGRLRIGGVPWPMWVRCGVAHVQLGWEICCGKPAARMRARWNLEKYRGCLEEFRAGRAQAEPAA